MSERYKCKLCDKDYLSMSARSNHVKRVHKKIIIQNHPKKSSKSHPISSIEGYKCRNCNKEYKYIQGRWKHEQKCKEKPNEMNQINNTTNNNIQNAKTINNNIDNKQIVINNFGNNNLDCLTEEFKKKLLKEFIFEEDHVNIIPTLIKKINFNPDYKENNNAKITNFKSKVGYKYEGKKWIAIEKEELLNKLYTMGDEYIDKIIDNLEHIPINIQEGYEEFQGKKDTLKKLMKQKIETTCYLYFKNCEDEF